MTQGYKRIPPTRVLQQTAPPIDISGNLSPTPPPTPSPHWDGSGLWGRFFPWIISVETCQGWLHCKYLQGLLHGVRLLCFMSFQLFWKRFTSLHDKWSLFFFSTLMYVIFSAGKTHLSTKSAIIQTAVRSESFSVLCMVNYVHPNSFWLTGTNF